MADNNLIDTLIAQFQAQQARANAANEKRYKEGIAIFDSVIDRYKEGGSFLAATEAQLDRAGTKSVASGMQNLVSSGLAGTTQTAGLQKKFEEEVGAPTRLKAQDIASQRLSQAEVGKAGLIERRDDVGPDYATIASLAKSIGQGQTSQAAAPAPTYTHISKKQPSFAQQASARWTASSSSKSRTNSFTNFNRS